MFKFLKKQNNDRILIFGAILLLILSGGLVFWYSVRKHAGSRVLPVLALKIIGKANLTIDFGDGRIRVFEGDIIENENIFDVLSQAAKAGKFSYKLDENSNLASIEKLLGNNKKNWHWSVNGIKINKPIGEVIVKPGDKILIKYE